MYYQCKTPPQSSSGAQAIVAEKKVLVRKLEASLREAERELKAEEEQLLHFQDSVKATKLVTNQAYVLITNLTAALNSATKAIARSKLATEQAMAEIAEQTIVVAKAKEKVSDFAEKLQHAQIALEVAKEVAMDADGISGSSTISSGEFPSEIGTDSESDGCSLISPDPSVCQECV